MAELDREWLLRKALKAYGIKEEYVLSSRLDPDSGEIVLVTHGGKRVRYGDGRQVDMLSEIEVTGVNVNQKKRKPVAGKVRS